MRKIVISRRLLFRIPALSARAVQAPGPGNFRGRSDCSAAQICRGRRLEPPFLTCMPSWWAGAANARQRDHTEAQGFLAEIDVAPLNFENSRQATLEYVAQNKHSVRGFQKFQSREVQQNPKPEIA